jgi:hypothetical protein
METGPWLPAGNVRAGAWLGWRPPHDAVPIFILSRNPEDEPARVLEGEGVTHPRYRVVS